MTRPLAITANTPMASNTFVQMPANTKILIRLLRFIIGYTGRQQLHLQHIWYIFNHWAAKGQKKPSATVVIRLTGTHRCRWSSSEPSAVPAAPFWWHPGGSQRHCWWERAEEPGGTLPRIWWWSWTASLETSETKRGRLICDSHLKEVSIWQRPGAGRGHRLVVYLYLT